MAKDNVYLLSLIFLISILGLSLLLLLNFQLFLRQIFFGFFPGIFLGIFLYKINLLKFKKYLPLLFFFFLVLCFLTLISPFSKKIYGASRWLDLKFFTFQPSEVFKLIIILYLAAFFEKKRSTLNFLVLFFISTFVFLLQPHFSTFIIISVIFATMLFLGSFSFWQFLKPILIIGIFGIFFALLEPYRVQRFLTFLDPYKDPLGSGYQLVQAHIHIGSGRIFGQGFFPKTSHAFLPQSFSDAIFAVFAQKTGFLGSFLLLLCYFFIFILGMRIASKQKNAFLRLSAQGISVWLAFQAFFNIGALLGLFPLAGVPLPFMSAGGSAILGQILAIAILLNIGKK